MKRFLCLFLALAVGTMLAVPAMAAGSTSEYAPIPELKGLVTFSNDALSAVPGTTYDYSFEDASFDEEEIVIYDFPVGTEIRVTDEAIAQGYSLMTFSYDRAYYETSVTITYADIYRAYIGLYRFPDEETTEEIDFYVRGVNTDTNFTDVKESDYCAKSVEWAVKHGITNGTGNGAFSPNKTCSQEEILTFMYRAEGMAHDDYYEYFENPFTDVKESDFFYGPAVWAYFNGLREEETFNGSEPCSRMDVVTYLYLLNDGSIYPDLSLIENFTDLPEGEFARAAIVWAVENGITTGTSATTFSPGKTCTRGEIVTFLFRAYAEQ